MHYKLFIKTKIKTRIDYTHNGFSLIYNEELIMGAPKLTIYNFKCDYDDAIFYRYYQSLFSMDECAVLNKLLNKRFFHHKLIKPLFKIKGQLLK